MLERVMIIGSAGQLGTQLMAAFHDVDPIGLDRSSIDIEDDASVEAAFERVRPTLVINTAAFHNVDECERNPHRAFAMNTIAVDRVASASARFQAAFATISSDYVFDGTLGRPYREADEALPRSVYGLSKRAGELAARRHSPRWFVVRTSGLYGAAATQKGTPFVERILRQAQAGETPRVVSDITFSPSYAPDVAAAMRAIVSSQAFGLYHVTNAGECTWLAFARRALELSGSPTSIDACSYRDFNPAVERPAYSALAHDALGAIGYTMPPWPKALARYIAKRSR